MVPDLYHYLDGGRRRQEVLDQIEPLGHRSFYTSQLRLLVLKTPRGKLWAGLRKMSGLEFEKADRGEDYPGKQDCLRGDNIPDNMCRIV